jgi:hypothetical protein
MSGCTRRWVVGTPAPGSLRHEPWGWPFATSASTRAGVRPGRVGGPPRPGRPRAEARSCRTAQRRPGRASTGPPLRRGPRHLAQPAGAESGQGVRGGLLPASQRLHQRAPERRLRSGHRETAGWQADRDGCPRLLQGPPPRPQAGGLDPHCRRRRCRALAHRVADGNTEHTTTHIATWEGLCQLLGRNDF